VGRARGQGRCLHPSHPPGTSCNPLRHPIWAGILRSCRAGAAHASNDWAGQGSGSAIGIRGPGGICPFAWGASPSARWPPMSLSLLGGGAIHHLARAGRELTPHHLLQAAARPLAISPLHAMRVHNPPLGLIMGLGPRGWCHDPERAGLAVLTMGRTAKGAISQGLATNGAHPAIEPAKATRPARVGPLPHGGGRFHLTS
jgi:hypothetical protein